jgi:hypothetical protein
VKGEKPRCAIDLARIMAAEKLPRKLLGARIRTVIAAAVTAMTV